MGDEEYKQEDNKYYLHNVGKWSFCIKMNTIV